MKKVFLFLATSAAAVGCSEVELDSSIDAPATGEMLTITVNANESIDTRVAITENGDVWEAAWEQDDALAGWFTNSNSLVQFTMSGNCTADEATFMGQLGQGDLRLIYPYASGSVTNNIATISLAEQSIDMENSMANIGDNAPLISNEVATIVGGAMYAEATPTMQHIGAALQLNLKFENVAENQEITSVVIKGIGANADVDLTKTVAEDGFISADNGDITLSVANSGEIVEGEIYTINCNIFPFAIPADGSIDIDVTLEPITTSVDATVQSAATAKSFTIVNNEGEAVEFSRGKVHWLNAACDFEYEEVVTPPAGDLSADQETLLDLQATLGGTLNWAEGVEAWDGVTLNAEGAVTAINLAGKGLSGTIPAALATLTSLETLDLSGNALTGNVPVEFKDLAASTFKISGNSLSGEMPADVVNNPNYVAWDPMVNVFPQADDVAGAAATHANIQAYKLKLSAVGILRAVYWHCGGPNWTYTNTTGKGTRGGVACTGDMISDGFLVTAEETTATGYEPEWLRGLSDGFPDNVDTASDTDAYSGILVSTSKTRTLQLIGVAGTTAQALRNMSGTLPAELALQAGTGLGQIKISNSGLTGIDLRILGNIKFLQLSGCKIGLNINDVINSCAKLAVLSLSGCDLVGEVTDATFSNIIANKVPDIKNNPNLTGFISDDQFATMAVTDKAAFVSGTGITYTGM